MEDSEILRRENMSQKRKTRNAIDVCKKMEEDGEIERLYRDFHIHLKTAREKTVSFSLLLEVSSMGLTRVFSSLPWSSWDKNDLKNDRHLQG